MAEPILENIEWVDSWVPQAPQRDVTRLLAVGDSICRSYYQTLHKRCQPDLTCSRFATSRYMSNPDYTDDLARILRRHTYSVVTVNVGLHGWAYDEETYESDLPELLSFLRAEAPNATVIWVQTTPVRDRGDLTKLRQPEGEHLVGDDRVVERNARAKKVMDEAGVPVCDLYTPLLERADLYSPDGTHFNEEGTAFLGNTIADFLQTTIPDKFSD